MNCHVLRFCTDYFDVDCPNVPIEVTELQEDCTLIKELNYNMSGVEADWDIERPFRVRQPKKLLVIDDIIEERKLLSKKEARRVCGTVYGHRSCKGRCMGYHRVAGGKCCNKPWLTGKLKFATITSSLNSRSF
jgi:hypothetical protein